MVILTRVQSACNGKACGERLTLRVYLCLCTHLHQHTCSHHSSSSKDVTGELWFLLDACASVASIWHAVPAGTLLRSQYTAKACFVMYVVKAKHASRHGKANNNQEYSLRDICKFLYLSIV